MHNDYFFEILRTKLQQYELPFNNEDWQELADLLDSADQVLDTNFKQILASYELPLQPGDWAILEANLHGAFDASLRSSLETYSISFDSSDWESMEARLDQPFDTKIHEKIETHQVSFRNSDWKLFQRQFLTPVRPWYQDWRNYAAAASFLLFGLFAWNISGIQRLGEYPLQQITESNSILPLDLNATNELVKSSDQAVGSPGSLDFSTSKVSSHDSPQYEPLLALSPISENKTQIVSTEDLLFEKQEVPNEYIPFEKDPNEPTDEGDIALFVNSPVQYYDLGVMPDIANQPIQKVAQKKKLSPKIRLGFLAGPNFSKAELNDPGLEGYSTGTRVELELNEEWRIITGAQYSEKQYSNEVPIYHREGAPPVINTLDANFKMVEVPLLIGYNFPSKNDFNIYLMGGISTFATLEENYEQRSPAEISRNEEADILKRSLNTYASVHVASGVAYQIEDRISIQAEGFFQLGLNEMGNAQKKLYTQGIQIGLMYSLSQDNKPKNDKGNIQF